MVQALVTQSLEAATFTPAGEPEYVLVAELPGGLLSSATVAAPTSEKTITELRARFRSA